MITRRSQTIRNRNPRRGLHMPNMADRTSAHAVPGTGVNVAGVHVRVAVLAWEWADAPLPPRGRVALVHGAHISPRRRASARTTNVSHASRTAAGALSASGHRSPAMTASAADSHTCDISSSLASNCSTTLTGVRIGIDRPAASQFASCPAVYGPRSGMRAFISGGLSVLGDLFQVLGQIGSIVRSVLTAAADAGGGLLSILGGLLEKTAEFAKSAQGMAALRTIFAGLASVGESLGGALGTILPVLFGVLTDLAPLLATVVANLAPGIAAAVAGIAPLLGLFGFKAVADRAELGEQIGRCRPFGLRHGSRRVLPPVVHHRAEPGRFDRVQYAAGQLQRPRRQLHLTVRVQRPLRRAVPVQGQHRVPDVPLLLAVRDLQRGDPQPHRRFHLRVRRRLGPFDVGEFEHPDDPLTGLLVQRPGVPAQRVLRAGGHLAVKLDLHRSLSPSRCRSASLTAGSTVG